MKSRIYAELDSVMRDFFYGFTSIMHYCIIDLLDRRKHSFVGVNPDKNAQIIAFLSGLICTFTYELYQNDRARFALRSSRKNECF